MKEPLEPSPSPASRFKLPCNVNSMLAKYHPTGRLVTSARTQRSWAIIPRRFRCTQDLDLAMVAPIAHHHVSGIPWYNQLCSQMLCRHAGMVNGRHITGRLSVGLPQPEIRRAIGSGRLENESRPILTGLELFCVGFIPAMAGSRTDIMASASE
jgi:hypothetical protein